MRATDPRRSIAALVLLPLLLLVGLLAAGCGSDDDGGDAGESTSEESSASDDTSEDASPDEEESESEESEEESDDSGDTGDLAAEDAALCDPYMDMVEQLGELDYSAKPDAVAAEMGPLMKEWAATIPDAEQPPSMDDAAWDGLQALAARVNELPDEPTNADITAVEEGMTAQEQKDVDAAGKWFESTCAEA